MRVVMVTSVLVLLSLPIVWSTAATAQARRERPREQWVVSWTGSTQGPYPIGNPSAQPDLTLAFPSPEAGARDQAFRMIVRPSIWGREARVRLSNAYGTAPVTFDDVHVGLHLASSAVVTGTNQRVTFAGKGAVTVRQASRRGAMRWR